LLGGKYLCFMRRLALLISIDLSYPERLNNSTDIAAC
jgi:hypothetical protein